MKQRLALILFHGIILFFDVVVHLYLAWCIFFNTERARQIVLAYDRCGNVAMGQGNETISSWAGKKNGWQEKFINMLFSWLGENNHCDNNREKP